MVFMVHFSKIFNVIYLFTICSTNTILSVTGINSIEYNHIKMIINFWIYYEMHLNCWLYYTAIQIHNF